MNASELEHRARLRAAVRACIADLVNLGVSPDRMRGRTLAELLDMRAEAIVRLMRAPRP